MSALPPPWMKRDPLAKSAPEMSAPTYRGISMRVSAAVGVDHHDDVAGRGFETAREGVALALPGLRHVHTVRPQLACHFGGVVHRMAVHEHDFVDVAWHYGRHVRKILLLVECGNHDRHPRPLSISRQSVPNSR